MANTDYLRFDALSLKDLIVNKLTIDDTYSDQLFEGSDLSVLIDVFCYMFNTMSFLENAGASEAIFTDSQYYENMNRIVKMLGYNPGGFITSNIACKIGSREDFLFNTSELIGIPEFTTYTTELNDSNGEFIKYVFTEDYNFPIQGDYVSPSFKPILYNGYYKLYPTTFVASGIPFESYTLNEIPKTALLSHGNIKVYVREPDGTMRKWIGYPNLYNAKENPTDIPLPNTKDQRYFEYRINEKHQYVLTFGDNINGKQLVAKSEVSVIYLESNGADGEIGIDVINTEGVLKVEVQGLNDDFIRTQLFNNNPSHIAWGTDPNARLQQLTLHNDEPSSISKSAEDVDSIRRNAPDHFRTGARLITEADFEQYIAGNWSTSVYDIKAMNNWTYMTVFQNWLDQYGKLNHDIRHYDFQYADSCDFNNIYLFIKSFNIGNVSSTTKINIEDVCNKLKPLTSEIIPVNSFNTMFSPYLKGNVVTTDWDPQYENKIVITRDKNTMVALERIKQNVYEIITTFFKLKNQELGAVIDINNLYNSLMGINGVKNVQTSYLKAGEPSSKTEYFDGLSFGFWTPYIVEGKDFTTITGNHKLLDFQFPVLLNPDTFANLIDVVSEIYNISNIEF